VTSPRITIEEPRTPGYPVVKRTALGQQFNGAVLKSESRDRLKRADDGSMAPIVKPNGKHAQEMVVTCMTLPGTTAPAGLGEDESIPEPGEIVRLILKGKSFGDWIDAKKVLPDGTVAVGDIVSHTTASAQVYDAQGNESGPETTDQAVVDQARAKGRSVGVYGPLTLRVPAPESEWTPRAITAYRTLTQAETPRPSAGGPVAAAHAPAVSTPSGAGYASQYDEPPF